MSKSTCNCFDDNLNKVNVLFEDKLRDTPYIKESLTTTWANRVFSFKDLSPKVNIPVDVVYRRIKKDGTPYKSLEKTQVDFSMNYCPFCGRKLEN